MKKGFLVLFFLTGLFLLLFGISWLSLPERADLSGYVQKAENYRVEIIRDTLGIPHIYGKTDADVAFGLGYAQCEDDFNTLTDVLLATRGRLASEYGYTAAKTDYVVNFMGVWDAVDAKYETEVPPKVKAVAQAYADAVNLYAYQHSSVFSRFLFPVTGKDIVAGFTFKTPMFYGFDAILGDLAEGKLQEAFSKTDSIAFLWQEKEEVSLGSQGIALSPKRAADGTAKLLVNSHQPLQGPVAWYEARLHSEDGWNMVGGTFPGSPVIIHGHNNDLGWANTVNKPDLTDIYRLEINPDNQDQYWLDGEWVDLEHRTADILVRFFGPFRWTFSRDIKISRHGPVFETEQGAYALRWAGMGEVRTLEFLLKLNKAKNMTDFENALNMKAMPSINYVYADREGNIAHYYNAMFPRRKSGTDWDQILPGDRADLIWEGYLGFDQMPKTVNPVSGLVYNANNTPFEATDGDDDPKASDFSATMGLEMHQTNRAMQIESLLAKDSLVSEERFLEVKFDLGYHPESPQVIRLRQWLASDPGKGKLSGRYPEALAQLAEWDLQTDIGNKTAGLAVLTLKPVQKALPNGVVSDEEIARAFTNAVDWLTEHYGTTLVPYGELSVLRRGGKQYAVAGGPDVLRAVYSHDPDEYGELVDMAGDGFTMVVSWDSLGLRSSQAIHQYGAATSLPDSEHYNDQMEAFTSHQLREVFFEKERLENFVERRYHPLDYSK